MKQRHVLRLVLLLLVAAIGAWYRSTSHVPARPPASGAVVSAPPLGEPDAPAGTVIHSEIGFSSRARLAEHFRKHGGEFHAANEDEYLKLAQTLRDRPAGGDVQEATRSIDGVRCRFDRASGAFLAFDPDLTIRTFFRPNDGEAYFRRQLERSH